MTANPLNQPHSKCTVCIPELVRQLLDQWGMKTGCLKSEAKKLKCVACFLGLSWGLGLANNACATSITYQGIVPPDSSVTGTVHGDYTYNDPERVSYWSFYGNVGELVQVTMTRNEANLDPAFWLFEGLFSDTSEFELDGDGKFHSPMERLLAFGDEEIEDAFDGPFMDAQVYVFLTLPGTGAYTIAAGSYASEYPDADGYQFTLEVIGNSGQPDNNPAATVPESGSTLPMVGLAVLALGALRQLPTRLAAPENH